MMIHTKVRKVFHVPFVHVSFSVVSNTDAAFSFDTIMQFIWQSINQATAFHALQVDGSLMQGLDFFALLSFFPF